MTTQDSLSQQPVAALVRTKDQAFYIFNAVLSITILSVIGYVLMMRGEGSGSGLNFLPWFNVGMNLTTTTLLVSGYIAIKRRAVRVHKYLMVSAFAASMLFLVGYLTYSMTHGDTKYQGTGPIRIVYFVILITHVILSMGILPLAMTSLYFALKAQFERHKKVTKFTLPIWLYVSVTGIIIFFMLRGFPPVVP